MEKVNNGNRADSLGRFALVRSTAVTLGCFALLCGSALAQAAIEVSASSLPRLESLDTGFQAPRVDLSLSPQNSGGLGVVAGVSSFTPRGAAQTPGLVPRTSVDLGVRWRQTVHSQQFDVMAWRRVSAEDEAITLVQQRQPMYGARVEMKLDGVQKTGFAAEKGFIGVQLESGAKISIKRKDGRPMVYYRSTF